MSAPMTTAPERMNVAGRLREVERILFDRYDIDGVINQTIKEAAALLEAQSDTPLPSASADVAPEFPTGAIVNGEVCLNRLENTYMFECEAGPLAGCVDWQTLRQCFEYLTVYTYKAAALLEVQSKEIERLKQTTGFAEWREAMADNGRLREAIDWAIAKASFGEQYTELKYAKEGFRDIKNRLQGT